MSGNKISFEPPTRDAPDGPRLRKKAADLPRGEETLRNIYGSCPDGIHEVDLEGRLVSINPVGMRLLEIDDMSSYRLAFWPDFWAGPARDLAVRALADAAAGRSTRFQGVCSVVNGSIKWWDVVVAPLRDKTEKAKGILAVLRDISEFKVQEQDIREQAQRDAFSAHIGNHLTRNLSLSIMLGECTQAMVDDLQAAFARIWLFNEADNVLELVASSGLYTHLDGGHARIPVGKFKIGLIASERLPHLTNAVLNDPRVPQQEWVKREGMVAFAGYPLIVENRLLGVMAMFARQPIPENTFQAMAVAAKQIALGAERKLSEKREEKLAAETLAATAKFRSVFDQSAVFAGIMTIGGEVIEANRLCLEFCGYRAEQVLGKLFWETPWWRNSKEVQCKIQAGSRQAAQGVRYVEALPYWTADGAERLVDFSLHPIRDDQGNVIFLHPTGVDITERKRAEARAALLDRLTEKLSLVSNPSEIARISARELGGFLGAQGCCLLETVAEDGVARALPGWRLDERLNLEGIHRLSDFGLPQSWQAVQTGPLVIEDVHANPWTRDFSGNYRKLNIGAYILAPFVQLGGWIGCVGAFSEKARVWTESEVTLLREAVVRIWPLVLRGRAEEAVREGEERFRSMADNTPQFAWMAEQNGAIFWFNRRWHDYTGATLDAMKGWGWQKVLHPEHAERIIEKFKRHIASAELWEDTIPLRGKDGNYRWFLSRATPLRDGQDNVIRWFGTNTDITELRESRLALEEAKELLAKNNSELEERVLKRTSDLTEINNQLETLVYSIAHDLRAPLRSMQAFSTILLTDYISALDDTAQDYSRRIIRAAEKMDALVHDLLAYGRTARLELVAEEVDVESAWNLAMQQHESDIHDRKAIVEAILPLPRVLANEAMLVQVFANLIGNALKFVAPGVIPRITLSAEIKPASHRLWISDNGIGIAAEYHERIFRVFERLHGRAYAGTGIGLSIVRKGVEHMGGTVGVESELARGSRFWLEFPRI